MKVPPLAPLAPSPIEPRQGPDGAREPGSAYIAPARIAPPKRNRDDVDPQIRKAAEGLESMFMNQMMQAMRNTVGESEFSLENPATKIYRGMLDTEVSQRAARTNSIGLADQIIAYLEQRGYTGNKAPRTGSAAPAADPQASRKATATPTKAGAKESTGGTDAS